MVLALNHTERKNLWKMLDLFPGHPHYYKSYDKEIRIYFWGKRKYVNEKKSRKERCKTSFTDLAKSYDQHIRT